MPQRTADFSDREHPRYWWYKQVRPAYDPPAIAMLSDAEWDVITAWYAQTEKDKPNGTGECAVPAISFLHGLIMGNNISRIVQLGHFIGFSTLLLGFALRQMGATRSLFSIDLDPNVTAYTQDWIDRAGLNAQVKLKVADSSDPANIPETIAYFGGAPQLVFIDSSHQYEHTIKELDLWYPVLKPGGFICMHDVSQYAATFDYTKKGGVAAAVQEWLTRSDASGILLNGNLTNQGGQLLTYRDGCGLGVIQKPLSTVAAS